MASKVNTKFVIGLSAGLLIVCAGVAGSAFFFLRNSASDLMSIGDKKLATGNMQEAVQAYGKAVNKEQTNIAYLSKWIEAMEKYAPESDTKFGGVYREWLAAKRRIAVLQPGVLEPALAYTKVRWELIGDGFSREVYEGFASELEENLRSLEGAKGDELRGYLGLARIKLALEGSDVSAESIRAPMELLRAGLAANPNNAEIAREMIEAHMTLARRLELQRRPDEAAAQAQAADDLTSELLAKAPDNLGALSARVNQNLRSLQREVREASGAIKPEEASRKFNEEARPLYDRMHAALLAKADLKPADIEQFRGVEVLLDGMALKRTEEVLRAGLAKQPSNVGLTIALAEMLASRGDFASAEAEIAKVATMPRLPVGNAGFALLQQRGPATGLQAMWTVRVWEAMDAGPERDAKLVKARELRGKLSELVSPDNNVLRLVDAQLAFVENTTDANQRAAQLLEKFNVETGGNVDSMALTAQLAQRRNEPGKARDALRRLIGMQPFNINALLALMELEVRLQNSEGARDAARAVLTLDPTNQRALGVLDVSRALTGTGDSTDPVVQRLRAIERFAEENGQDPQLDTKLRDMLKQALQEGGEDPRLMLAASQSHLRLGERSEAIALLEKALEKSPNNPAVRSMLLAARSESPVDGAIAAIDAGEGTELQKAVEKSRVFAGFGIEAKAKEWLEKARALDAENPAVVDMSFTRALATGDLAAARQFAELAVRKNIDNLQGDTFRARMLLGEGKPDQAAAVMKQIVERGGAGPEVLRLQARILMANDQPAEAATVLRRSLDARPSDPQVWSDLVEALVRSGKPTEALGAAREGRRFAEGDPRFLDALLNLEAQVGNRRDALVQRERLARISPKDRTNWIALARLHIEDSNREGVEKSIDAIKALPTEGDGLDVVQLEALHYLSMNDLASADNTWKAAIAAIPEDKRTVRPYLLHAQFMLEQGLGDQAVLAAEAGKAYQTKGVLEIERYLSDVFARFGQTRAMVAASREVLAGNADTTDQLYQKRLVEGLVQLGQFEEAATELAKLPQGDTMDVSGLLIAAAVKEGQKDEAAERTLLNQAVSRFPNSPMAFMRRGRFFMRTGNARDGLADATKAIELAPNNATFLRERARMHQQQNDMTAMFSDLKAAALASPQDGQAIFALLQELRTAGRDNEAADLATQVQAKRPTDAVFAMQLAGFFRSVGQYDIARDFARRGHEQDRSVPFAQQYLDVLLEGPSPNIAEVERVLTLAGPDATKSPGLLMARAKQRLAQNRAAEAQRLSQDAVKLLNPSSQDEFSAWYNDFRRILTGTPERVAALDAFAKAGVAPEWMTFFRASEQAKEEATRATGLRDLTALQTSGKIDAVRFITAQQLGGFHYERKEYAEAVNAWKAGLAVRPDDVGLMNNAAYVLVKFLGKPADALPLAQKAHERSPSNADIADTLGLAKLETGATDDAIALFMQARRGATSVSTLVQSSIHLADAYLRKGEKTLAKAAMQELDARLQGVPEEALATSKAELEAMRSKVEGS
jgi:tetratricopeptide (TPR) repeat protein